MSSGVRGAPGTASGAGVTGAQAHTVCSGRAGVRLAWGSGPGGSTARPAESGRASKQRCLSRAWEHGWASSRGRPMGRSAMCSPDVPGRSGRLAGRALHTREATRWLQQAQEQGLSAPSFLGENLIRDVGGGRRVCAMAATVPAPRASEAACALRRGRAGAGGRVGGRGPGVGSGLRPGAESQEEMGCCCSGPRRRPSRRNEEARGWQGGPRRGGDVGRPGGELEPSRWWRVP